MKNCSIIIPHYNGKKILRRCLNSLIETTPSNHEIIVVDNASSDDSLSMLEKDFSQVRTISNKTNLGYAGACNVGALNSTNDYLIFLNNDTELTNHWIEPLITQLENEKVASVQPKIKNLDNKKYFDYAGAAGGYIDIFGYPFCRGRIFDTIEKDNLQYESKETVFWASGTAFATKKEIFIKSGMFDLTMFAHMEEIDYHWRSQMMGYKIIMTPESTIYHEGAKTLSYESSQKTYLNHRNSLIIFLTNHKLLLLLSLFIPRILLQLISILKDLVSFRLTHAIAQCKALGWIFISPIYLINKRKNSKKIQIKNYKLKGLLKGSIVINYFLLRKKYYTEY